MMAFWAASAVLVAIVSLKNVACSDPLAQVPLVGKIECRDTFNKAREHVGFKPFQPPSPSDEAIIDDPELWNSICNVIALPKRNGGRVFRSIPATTDLEILAFLDLDHGTWAYVHPQTPEPTCEDAANLWTDAARSHDTLPPVYNQNEAYYRALCNVSFVALYNNDIAATVSCREFQCPNQTATGEHETEGSSKGADASETKSPAKGMLCLTTPAAYGPTHTKGPLPNLAGKEPATEYTKSSSSNLGFLSSESAVAVGCGLTSTCNDDKGFVFCIFKTATTPLAGSPKATTTFANAVKARKDAGITIATLKEQDLNTPLTSGASKVALSAFATAIMALSPFLL